MVANALKGLIAILLVFLTGCQFFLYPDENEPNPIESKLKLLWEVESDDVGLGIKTAPLVLGDSLVIMSAGSKVKAIEQNTGKVRWEYFVSNLTNTHSNDFLTDGENIYFTHVEDIRAINLKDGNEEWILPLPNERGAFNDENFILENGKIYLPGYQILYCINPTNGNIEWQKKLLFNNRGTLGMPTYYEHKIIIFSSEGYDDSTTHSIAGIIERMHVLNAETGDSILTKLNLSDGLVERVAVEDNFLYGGSHFPYTNSCFYKYDMETNEIVWAYFRSNDGRDYTDCVIAEDKVIVRTGPTYVSAFNKETGELLWITNTIQIPESGGSIRYYKGYIYHEQGGRLFILDPNNGNIIHSQLGPRGQTFERFTVANDKIFVSGYPTLQCYETFKGK